MIFSRNATIVLPGAGSTITCGLVVADPDIPPLNARTLLFSFERPASMNANSSTTNVMYNDFVSGFQSYTLAILLDAFGVVLLTLSDTWKVYLEIPNSSSAPTSSTTF